MIARSPSAATRKRALIAAVAFDLGLLAVFKYLSFFVSETDNALDSIGLGSLDPAGPDRASDRDLVLHLPGDLLRGGRVPGRDPRRPARGRGDPPGVLPAPRGRADRAGERAAPPAAHAARSAHRARRPGDLPDRRRPAQEDGDRRRAGAAGGRPGLQRSRGALGGRDHARVLRVRRADLLRLLRLHGPGDRACAAARLPAASELQPPVPRALAPGLLAPLAHDALALAARLPLHPAGRQPQGAPEDVPQRDDHHAARRALARGVVDLPALGRHPRRGPLGGALDPGALRRGCAFRHGSPGS